MPNLIQGIQFYLVVVRSVTSIRYLLGSLPSVAMDRDGVKKGKSLWSPFSSYVIITMFWQNMARTDHFFNQTFIDFCSPDVCICNGTRVPFVCLLFVA